MEGAARIKGESLIDVLERRDWYIDRRSARHVVMRNHRKAGLKVTIPAPEVKLLPGTVSNIKKLILE